MTRTRFFQLLAMAWPILALGALPATITTYAAGQCHGWAYYMGFWSGEQAWQRQAGVMADGPPRWPPQP